MSKAKQQDWPADKVERRKVSDLVPYARNSRTHSDAQVAQIAASIREWGWTTPVLVDEEGTIIAGHGRVMAAQRLGLDEVPCMVARGWTEAQRKAYVIADNKLALNAGWDDEMLRVEFGEIQALDFDLSLTGFGEEELAGLFDDALADAEAEAALSDVYTQKIEAPIYEITGERPTLAQMMDRSKTCELLERIDASGVPEDVRAFLRFAAERHTVFDFRHIAEFYAHADAEVQDLMEQSALVIIDFNRAIEEGFVKLSKRLDGLVSNDE